MKISRYINIYKYISDELLKSKEYFVAVLFVPIDLAMTKKRSVNGFIKYNRITRNLGFAL